MKKIRIAVIAAVLLLGIFVLCSAASAASSNYGWTKEGDHLLYYNYNGTYKTGRQTISSKIYNFTSQGWLIGTGEVYKLYYKLNYYSDNEYFFPNENGYLQYGWQTAAGKRYYFDPVTGRAFRYGLNDGPCKIDNVLYLFDTEGVLQVSQWYKDSYGNSQGAAATGYQQIDEKYYFFDDQGKALNGFLPVNGVDHFFTYGTYAVDRYELRGWVHRSGNLYYFDPDTGAMHTGNVTIRGQSYTLSSVGTLTVTGKTVVFDPDFVFGVDAGGNILRNWQTIDGYSYYFDINSSSSCADKGIQYTAKKGLFRDGSFSPKYYYFDEIGRMQTNFLFSGDEDTYFFGSDGIAVGGWQTIDGVTYYFDPYRFTAYKDTVRSMNGPDDERGVFAFDSQGKLRTNELIRSEGKIYYLGADGRAISGWKTIDGVTYFFDDLYWYAYQDVIDIIRIDGVEYLFAFDEDGRMLTSQLVWEWRDLYYMGPDGRAVSGWVTIDGYLYYFSPEDHTAIVGKSVVLLKDGNYQEFTFDDQGRVCAEDGNPYGAIPVNGLRYKLNAKKKTAIFLYPEDREAASISIPKTVKYDGKTYKVVEISAEACKGMTSLTKVTIGDNVSKIGKNAFNDCVNLKNITIKTKTLTGSNVKSGAFKTGNKKSTVKCPKGMKDAYEQLLLKKGLKKTTKFK